MKIIASEDLHNTYYLFRNNNDEVKIEISGEKILTDKGISAKERSYIYKKYIKREVHTIYNKLALLNESQLKEVTIMVDKLLNL